MRSTVFNGLNADMFFMLLLFVKRPTYVQQNREICSDIMCSVWIYGSILMCAGGCVDMNNLFRCGRLKFMLFYICGWS